jgi:hypothetical protein
LLFFIGSSSGGVVFVHFTTHQKDFGSFLRKPEKMRQSDRFACESATQDPSVGASIDEALIICVPPPPPVSAEIA